MCPLFDDGDELVREGDDGLPSEILVVDYTGAFLLNISCPWRHSPPATRILLTVAVRLFLICERSPPPTLTPSVTSSCRFKVTTAFAARV